MSRTFVHRVADQGVGQAGAIHNRVRIRVHACKEWREWRARRVCCSLHAPRINNLHIITRVCEPHYSRVTRTRMSSWLWSVLYDRAMETEHKLFIDHYSTCSETCWITPWITCAIWLPYKRAKLWVTGPLLHWRLSSWTDMATVLFCQAIYSMLRHPKARVLLYESQGVQIKLH